ncbi:hypothetical protein RDABS01_032441 [Bienertia sinuspersici]
MDCGNTSLQNVFYLILSVAVKEKLAKEQMIKRRNFEEKEYGDAAPEILFLNLRDSKLNPVLKDQKGMESIMYLILKLLWRLLFSGDEYSKLLVSD